MNTTFDHRCSIPISFGNMSKINPFNQRKNSNVFNKISSRRKINIPSTTREFGKEINISTNLTTFNNQETFNNRRSLGIPIDKKMKKDIQINKIKNSQQIAFKKRKKEGTNSFHKKPNSSNGKYCTNKNSREKQNKQSIKLRNKNQSQKSILTSNHSININDDVIMKDENTNPNIMAKVYSTNRNNTINAIPRSTNKMI